jgi:hypothetical protein
MLFSANSHGRGDGKVKWIFDVNSSSAGLLSAGMKFGPLRNSTASVSFESPLAHFGWTGASRRLAGHASQ